MILGSMNYLSILPRPRAVFASLLWIILIASQVSYSIPAQAAVADWMRGANVMPTSPTDFSSSSFQQSMRNLRATGATSVALIVPFYQSNIYSTDIGPGYNTPTDTALASAIDFAHSIGFTVMVKLHVDAYDGSWRAHINPSDRASWFTNYGNHLLHIAGVAAQHNVELISIGTELVSMASTQINSTNTDHWNALIERVRSTYSGKLTYGANSTNNNNDTFQNEKKFIAFWPALDYAGLSVYYTISTGDNSIASLESSWDYWNKNDLQAFAQTIGKPLLFSEVGYRSVSGAHYAPWDWGRGGSVDLTEQSNDYYALFEYWNAYNYVHGVYLWDWSTNPNAGGSGSTDYTPQHKPAEQVMKQWFSAAPPPPPPSSAPVFRDTTNAGSQISAGTPSTITVTIEDVSGALTSGIVDIEVYDSSNQRAMQKFVEGQSFTSGTSRSYTAEWTPSVAGTYRVTVGVFSGDWSKNYYWNNDAFDITVGAGSSPPPPPPSGTAVTEIWWPTDGARVSGVQPLKAMVQNMDISHYTMQWRVDDGGLVTMYNSSADYPHKEAMIDYTNWHWRGAGPYTLTLVSTDQSGKIISQNSIRIYTQ